MGHTKYLECTQITTMEISVIVFYQLSGWLQAKINSLRTYSDVVIDLYENFHLTDTDMLNITDTDTDTDTDKEKKRIHIYQ